MSATRMRLAGYGLLTVIVVYFAIEASSRRREIVQLQASTAAREIEIAERVAVFTELAEIGARVELRIRQLEAKLRDP